MRKTYKTQLKIRETALGTLALIAITITATAWPQHAAAVSLKHSSVIEGDRITLGDLFTGLERNEDRVLGPAPRPGQDMVLNARTLLRIAIALDLQWRPVSSADQVILRRAATVIDEDMIKDTLKNELVSDGLNGKFNIIIPKEMSEMILPADQIRSVEVTDMDFNPTQNRFSAILVAPSKDNPLHRTSIQGSVQRLVEVPVLRDTLSNGVVIGARDIEYIDLPEHRLKHNMIVDASELVGMTPRRILFADKPIKTTDIEAPRIVGRGERVTMIFKQGALTLTAKGKALEYGAKGDVIRVSNASSSRTVDAMVIGENEVMVQSF